MSEDKEVMVKINYIRRYNLSNYNHKEYAIELTGTETQLEEQFKDKSAKLQGFIEGLETLIELAHEANQLKARLPRVAENAEAVRGSGGGSN